MTIQWQYPSNFPGALDDFLTNPADQLVDHVDEVIANHPNSLASAVDAIEKKLGLDNDPMIGIGGVSFHTTGHVSNPGATGEPTIWLDTSGSTYVLMYTDNNNVTSPLGSGTGLGAALTDWTTSTVYSLNQEVTHLDLRFRCISAHTSNVFFNELNRWESACNEAFIVQQSCGSIPSTSVIYRDAVTHLWTLAQADAGTTLSDPPTVVIGKNNTNTYFLAVCDGSVDVSTLTAWTALSLVEGQVYYLSAATPGAITATEPVADYSNPVIKVRASTLVPLTLSINILPYRPSTSSAGANPWTRVSSPSSGVLPSVTTDTILVGATGNATNPAIAWYANPDTGFYLDTNSVNISSNGKQTLRVDSTTAPYASVISDTLATPPRLVNYSNFLISSSALEDIGYIDFNALASPVTYVQQKARGRSAPAGNGDYQISVLKGGAMPSAAQFEIDGNQTATTVYVRALLSVGVDEAPGTPNIAGSIQLISAGNNAYSSTFTAGSQSANAAYTLPTALPISSMNLQCSSTGVLTWASGTVGVATTITVASEILDASCYPLFVISETGDLDPKTHPSFTFDSTTGKLGSLLITAGTGITPSANDGAYLGQGTLGFSDLFLASGGVINWANSDLTLTHSSNTLTLGGGDLALGANNLAMTGSIGDTTNRVLKGWFTDIDVTNALGVSITGNAATVTVGNESTDTTCFPLFVTDSAVGSYSPKSTTTLTFNSNTGALASSLFTANTITANTGIVPDADAGAYLGTTALGWSNLFLASTGVINWANGNATITHATGSLTVAATTLALGTTNLTMTGAIAATGARVSKGWFADLESSAGITLGVDAAGGNANTAGVLKLISTGDNAFYNTFTSGTNTANATYTLPTSMPASTMVLQSTNAGVMSWVTPTVYEVPLTFSTGLARAVNTITATLSTGLAGGQSVVGSILASENLTLSSTTHGTKGSILFGTSAYVESTNLLGLGIATPTLSTLHILKVNANYLLPALLITGASTGTGAGEAAQGFGLYLTYNTSGNHQMLFAENETGKGVRYIGHGLDGCTVAGARADLNLGTDTNGAHVGTAVGSTQFSVSNLNGTASKVVCEIKGAAAQSGNYLNITTDQYTHPGEILQVTSTGDMFLGTYTTTGVIGRLVVQGAALDNTYNIFVGRDSNNANVTTLDCSGSLTLKPFVGITSTGKLDVNNTNSSSVVIRGVSATWQAATVDIGKIEFSSWVLDSGSVTSGRISTRLNDPGNSFASDLLLWATPVAGTPLEYMRIKSTGETLIYSGATLGAYGATNTPGTLKLWSSGSSNAFYNTFTSGVNTATATYTLPLSMPAGTTLLQSTSTGTLSWAAYPTRTYTLLAGGAAIGTTAPATRETRELPGTGKQVVDVLNFPYGLDSGTGTAWWSFPMPDAYNSGTFVVTVHYFTAVADAGNIIFQLQMSSAGDAENMDVAASTAAELTAPASATANYQRYASFAAHTCAGSPAPGHMIFLKLYRSAAHGSDSCTHDAFVQSVKVEFVSNSFSD